MKHLKGFNENSDLPEGLNVNGLKCDNPNCDWSDMSVPFSDYEKSINKPCPQCGENLLTQEDYDQVIQIKQAMELMATFSEEELNNIVSSLSEEEIDQALDKMNQLKMKKKGEDEQGREIWSIGESRELKNIKKFNEGWFSKDEENEPVDAVNSKIEDAAYSLGSFGTMTKQAAFINGAKWAIQNLTDDEIKLLRENTDKDDHSFFGL